MAANGIKTLTDTTFDSEVLKGARPTLVDFWAEWCGPCKAIAPTLEDLSREYDGKLVVGKLNIDEHPGIAQRYNIRSIPTLLLFKDGRVAGQLLGAVPKSKMKDFIDKNV